MSERRAIVIGAFGQDGTLLQGQLDARGYAVLRVGRNAVHDPGGPAASTLALTDSGEVSAAVRNFAPHEIYYLAAYHGPAEASQAAQDPRSDLLESLHVHCVGLVNFLGAVLHHSPECRLFYASSSLVFPDSGPQLKLTEDTAIQPQCEYALTKALGGRACAKYRALGVFASVGLLFNHESALRGPRFVTQRIIRSALRIRAGSDEKLTLADLDAIVDWGHAADYVDAFVRILRLNEPGEFVIATGEGHTVREFASIVFDHLNLDWRVHVVTGGDSLTRRRSGRVGDASKLRRLTGWKPAMPFEAMVRTLVDETGARLASATTRASGAA